MAWINTKSKEAREHLLAGVELLAHAVGKSMGPEGRNTVVDFAPLVPGSPFSTRDGVTIARSIYISDDLIADAGSRLVRGAAEQTVITAGDGTSASVVLAHAFFAAGLKQLDVDPNVRRVTKAIREVAKQAEAYIKGLAQQVSGEMIDFVSTISVNNDPVLGKHVADAVRASGAHGVVSVEDSPTAETTIERQEGMQFASGWRSDGFVNNGAKMLCELEEPYIYMLDRRLTSLQGFQPMLAHIQKSGRPLLILAEDVDGEALAYLLSQKAAAGLAVCCVKLPSNLGHRKDLLLDIASMCGGRPMLKDLGDNPADAKPNDLGSCRRVVISRNSTRIIGGKGSKAAVAQRIQEIKGLLALNPPQIEVERLNERLAKLTGGVTILSLGAQTGVELADKKMRVDDAVNAIRCAIEEGVVPGAGTALLRAAKLQQNETNKWAVECLTATFKQILNNASGDPKVVAEKVLAKEDAWYGYDVVGEEFGDLRELGVLDPLKVVRSSLANAASIACQLLLTEMVVTLDQRK
jgi:chaperonin GroEL